MDKQKPMLLVVDDDKMSLFVVAEYLDGFGCEHDVALNGAEALKMLETDPDRYDVVILDRMMPEMDGLQMLAKIAANEHLKAIPVIMQTAKATRQNCEEGMQAGAFHYLTKPYDKKSFLQVLTQALKQAGFDSFGTN
jgi:CheY-like chemotaxis protein